MSNIWRPLDFDSLESMNTEADEEEVISVDDDEEPTKCNYSSSGSESK